MSIRGQVKREYLLKGLCESYGHKFSRKKQEKDMRCLVYIVYCLNCYRFPQPGHKNETFISKCYNNWKKAVENFHDHVGRPFLASECNSSRMGSRIATPCLLKFLLV